VNFKKAFDRVWYAALWATMKMYNTNANLINTIKQLYDKASSAVSLNGSIGDWFETTVGVRKRLFAFSNSLPHLIGKNHD